MTVKVSFMTISDDTVGSNIQRCANRFVPVLKRNRLLLNVRAFTIGSPLLRSQGIQIRGHISVMLPISASTSSAFFQLSNILAYSDAHSSHSTTLLSLFSTNRSRFRNALSATAHLSAMLSSLSFAFQAFEFDKANNDQQV